MKDRLLYVSEINALIPAAEAAAASDLRSYIKNGGAAIENRPAMKGKKLFSSVGHQIVAGGYYVDYRQHCMWTEFFHKHMNRLAREHGLRTI